MVGWYRSHPDGSPDPTVGDIRVQVALQDAANATASGAGPGVQPFVGAIVVPYRRRHGYGTC